MCDSMIVESTVAQAAPDNKRNSEGDVLVLNDGTLLCAWSDFYGGAGDDSGARISAVKSTDGGATWSERFTLQENVGAQNVMSATLLRLKSGSVLLFYLVKNSRADLDLRVKRSDDDCVTWTDSVLVTPEPGYYIMNNARAVQLKSGRIVCPISFTEEVWTAKEAFRTVAYFSDDEGKTWSRGEGVVTCPMRGAMEPGLVELDDGRVLQIIRTQTGKIWHCYSSDGGNTWTEAEPWTVAAPEAPSTLVRMPDNGDFLLVYNPGVADGADHGGRRTPLVSSISADEGKTWSEPRVIEPDPKATYAYTSVTFAEDRALLSYYVERGGLLSLKFKSIPLEWFRGE